MGADVLQRARQGIDRTRPAAAPRFQPVVDWGDLPDDVWWDPHGPAKLLHAMNPTRTGFFLRELGTVAGRRVVDAGCGGGLVAQPLSAAGATVVGLDLALPSLAVARRAAPGAFLPLAGRLERIPLADACVDAVVAADVLEHVGDLPAAVREIARVLKPGGRLLFDTINRTWWAWFVALFGAERVTGLVPRGTHDWRLFIHPDELDRLLGGAGLTAVTVLGLAPRIGPGHVVRALATRRLDPPPFTLGSDCRASYVGHYRKEQA